MLTVLAIGSHRRMHGRAQRRGHQRFTQLEGCHECWIEKEEASQTGWQMTHLTWCAQRSDHPGAMGVGRVPHGVCGAAARRRLRCAGCEEREGAGVAGAGCGCRPRCFASPSGTCGGGAWPWLWAAHPREAIDTPTTRAIRRANVSRWGTTTTHPSLAINGDRQDTVHVG